MCKVPRSGKNSSEGVEAVTPGNSGCSEAALRASESCSLSCWISTSLNTKLRWVLAFRLTAGGVSTAATAGSPLP